MGVHRSGGSRLTSRGGSYCQHRKSTFSTIVLPATYTFNKTASNLNLGPGNISNWPSPSGTTYVSTPGQTYLSRGQTYLSTHGQTCLSTHGQTCLSSSQTCLSSKQTSSYHASELSSKNNYTKLQMTTLELSNHGPLQMYRGPSFRERRTNFSSQNTDRKKDMYLTPTRTNFKNLSSTDISNSAQETFKDMKRVNSKEEVTIPMEIFSKRKLKRKEDCKVNLERSCCVETVCSNESCKAVPCSLSSCIFSESYVGSSSSPNLIDSRNVQPAECINKEERQHKILWVHKRITSSKSSGELHLLPNSHLQKQYSKKSLYSTRFKTSSI